MATSVAPRRPDPVGPALAPRRDDPRPLAVQLADGLRQAATDGRLRPGDRLPSTRALARRLGLSRTVTAAAYDQLAAEGWLRSRHGSGTFVAAAPSGRTPVRADAGSGPVAAGELTTATIDLRPGRPWTEGIDPAAWRRAWRAAGHAAPGRQRRVAGLDSYRVAVAEHLLRHRGLVVADPEAPSGVLATAGTAAAIMELAASVLAPGDAVAVEEPGWSRAVRCLRAAGLEVVPVPVDVHGLVPDAVPPRVRAVVVTPSHQYPMGARMPAPRRLALADLARRHGWIVVEDDYDGELRFDAAPPPLLAALAPDVVVHLGTTSKILSPTLGAGWMVAPAAIAEQVIGRRAATSGALSDAGQAVLVELARSGDLSRHLRRVRRELSGRRHHVVDRLAAVGVTVPGDDAGAHVVVPLPTADDERRLVGRAAARGVAVPALAEHYVDPDRPGRRYGAVVGYSLEDAASTADALELLVELITR